MLGSRSGRRCEKASLHHLILQTIHYQDRLGTNIGNDAKKRRYEQVPWPPMDEWYHIASNLVNRDPHFASKDPRSTLDFQLAENSPAYEMGFERIPMERFGPWR